MYLTSIFHKIATVTVMGLFFTGSAHAITVRGTPVTVMNTAPDGGSIPVTGTVGISGTPSVTVINTVPVSGSVVNPENPDRSLYQEYQSFSSSSNNFRLGTTFPTDAGKRYILNYLSITCFTDNAADSFLPPQLYISESAQYGMSMFPVYPIVLQKVYDPVDNLYQWVGSANFQLYSDSNGSNNIQMYINHTVTTANGHCSAMLAGHSISYP